MPQGPRDRGYVGVFMDGGHIVIITGLSGSGKSTAIKALEDSGFFCIDNLPVVLLPELLELNAGISEKPSRLALVMDVREREFFSQCPGTFQGLRKRGHSLRIVFLEASDECLIRRYSQTRRQHPLPHPGSLAESIRMERERFAVLRNMADLILDTTHMTPHQLRRTITDYFTEVPLGERMRIDLLSFGYKFGLPYEADLVMDVRFLPNPYFVPEMKAKDGRDPEVVRYVMEQEPAEPFLEKFGDLLLTLIPMYRKEGKSYLTIAVGCTGGRHRSVVVTESLAEFFNRHGIRVYLKHRDIGKE